MSTEVVTTRQAARYMDLKLLADGRLYMDMKTGDVLETDAVWRRWKVYEQVHFPKPQVLDTPAAEADAG